MCRRRSPSTAASAGPEAEGEDGPDVAPAMALIPAASPSMPSSRLMTFIIPTIQITVTTTENQYEAHQTPAREAEAVDVHAEVDGDADRETLTGELEGPRKAAEVVGHSDGRRDGGAEQDPRCS